MSSKYAYDICHGVEYGTQGKKRWTKVGAAFRDEETGRISLKLDYVPVGTGPVFLSLFEPKPKDDTGGNQGQTQSSNADRNPTDDVPF